MESAILCTVLMINVLLKAGLVSAVHVEPAANATSVAVEVDSVLGYGRSVVIFTVLVGGVTAVVDSVLVGGVTAIVDSVLVGGEVLNAVAGGHLIAFSHRTLK